jgi:hypothetical protein
MSAAYTRQISKELVEAIAHNEYVTKATDKPLIPLSEETEDVAVYVAIEDIVPESRRTGLGQSAYDRTIFFILTVYVNNDDHLFIHDVCDSLERSVLNDDEIFNYIIDRDFTRLAFDNGQFAPKRAVAITVEATYKLSCD